MTRSKVTARSHRRTLRRAHGAAQREAIDLIGIGRRFFSAVEHADLSTQSGDARTRAFFRAWTRKESYLKARGMGLSLPLDGFDVTLLPDQEPRLLATRFDPGDAARWTLTEIDPCDGYAGALCADLGERRLHTFTWNP